MRPLGRTSSCNDDIMSPQSSDKHANSSLLSPGQRNSGDAIQSRKCCKGLNVDNLAVSAQGMAF